jgi:hypothetical protein
MESKFRKTLTAKSLEQFKLEKNTANACGSGEANLQNFET